MSRVVCEPCVDCRYMQCVLVCPVDAFREGPRQLYIDPAVCVDCGACGPECPVEAIYPEAEVPEAWRAYIATNAEMAPRCPVITRSNRPPAGPSRDGKQSP